MEERTNREAEPTVAEIGSKVRTVYNELNRNAILGSPHKIHMRSRPVRRYTSDTKIVSILAVRAACIGRWRHKDVKEGAQDSGATNALHPWKMLA